VATIRKLKFQQKMTALRGTKKNVMQQAFAYFKGITPIDTGNARRNTRLINSNIEAKYPYASVLDKGRHSTSSGMRGSNQAPEGMSKPTIRRFKQWIKDFIRKI